MTSNEVEVLYAREGRCSDNSLKQQINDFNGLPFLKQALDATNSMILILNNCRQAIFANKIFLMMLNVKDGFELAGKHPCEIISCIHACGIGFSSTTKPCRYCTAMNTILKTIKTHGESSCEFSSITTINGYEQNINLAIHVAPLQVQQQNFYVVSIVDNSDSMRRKILDGIFFHDIIHTTNALKGIAELLKDDVSDKIKTKLEVVAESFKCLVEEIQTKNYVMDAEDNQLKVILVPIATIHD